MCVCVWGQKPDRRLGGQLTYGEVKDSFISDRKIILITTGVKCSVVTHSVSGRLPTVEALVNFSTTFKSATVEPAHTVKL